MCYHTRTKDGQCKTAHADNIAARREGRGRHQLWIGLIALGVLALLIPVFFGRHDADEYRSEAQARIRHAMVERNGKMFLDVQDAGGNITSSTEYKILDGKLVIDGEQVYFRADGSVSVIRRWKNGRDTGELIWLDVNGKRFTSDH